MEAKLALLIVVLVGRSTRPRWSVSGIEVGIARSGVSQLFSKNNKKWNDEINIDINYLVRYNLVKYDLLNCTLLNGGEVCL